LAVKTKSGGEKKKILVIHGPNLNLLGRREPDIYGRLDLNAINRKLKQLAGGFRLDCRQSNDEGDIVDMIHSPADGILINPAAYTHTSVAIRDALLGVKTPVVEVHLSNIFAREPFRHKSYVSDIAVGVVTGFGANSYYLGLKALMDHLSGA
jgi:3-dehydroquinate dehydratase-2